MDSIINNIQSNKSTAVQVRGYQDKPHKYSSDKISGLEKLLFQILTKFSGLIIDDYEKKIKEALRQVAEYLGFDRGTLCEFIDDEDTLKIITFYAKPGIPTPQTAKISPLMPEYEKEIKKGEIMLFSSSNEISKRFKIESIHAKETKLKSNIGLPIEVDGEFIGALTFDIYEKEKIWTRELVNKLTILAEIFSNVLTRRRSHERHQTILKLETLISSISTRLINMPTKNIDEEIETVMKDIGESVGIDRLKLFMLEDSVASEQNFRIRHYWSRFKDETRLMHGMKSSDYPWAVKKILAKEIFLFSHIDEIPRSASIDRQSLIKIETKSAIVIPLIFSDRVEGVLCFDSTSTQRNWTPEIISRAKIIAQVFSNVLARKKADMDLQYAFKTITKLKKQLESDYNYLKNEIEMAHNYHEIIGESAPLKHVLFKIDQVAPTDSTVLILGETGTGKELVAQAIHNRSPRKDRPLVRVNCAALSPTLIESELFGHEKGAFTGAHQKKRGRFEIAHGTSLFLDEIGELPLELQAKLLRVVQSGEFERMGSSRTRKVGVRIIVATNRDLDAEVNEGRFRKDLLYRLNVFPITVPPLRARTDDIPLLVNWFLQKYGKKMGKPIECISKESLEYLKQYPWMGNVRELENTIERAVINARGTAVEMGDISLLKEAAPVSTSQETAAHDTNEQMMAIPQTSLPEMKRHFGKMERDYIIKILESTKWRIAGPNGAARILGFKESTLRFQIKKLGIKKVYAHSNNL